jgi:hypothetical protein
MVVLSLKIAAIGKLKPASMSDTSTLEIIKSEMATATVLHTSSECICSMAFARVTGVSVAMAA